MENVSEKSGYYAALLFLVWPVLALASAFTNYRGSWGKNILWAFVAFYGMVFAIGAESQESDIVGYVTEVKHLHSVELSMNEAFNYYRESGEIDIFRTLIALVVSRVSSSQTLLTLVYGLIFGFFFSRNIWFVLERLKGKVQPITLLLLACFFLVVPFWFMNGFRFWTATHIFIYGLLPYLFEGKKSGAIVASLAILMHFAFIVPVGILYGYMFLGDRLVLYFCFFIATFFISQINLSVFNNIIENYAPKIVQERTSGYRSEEAVEEHREGGGKQTVWYVNYYLRAIDWSVRGFLVVLFLKGRRFFTKNKRWLSLFSFTLFFYGVATLLSSIPSGGRFITIVYLPALALITLYVQNREHEVVMKRFILAATPFLLLYIVVAVRIGLYSISSTAILGNPLIAMFLNGEHISLNDFMKSLL
ncbi:EpsG family protein [Aliifodinibius sp. S!AR15-10]|uniref:EpsG family protein n=1 Tax=Aliifodinibius sp. S!AR15-10 TaxID=2950437 RepID=UPI0028610486|nr:EpsG family protein [Aliifodinibius sp. S!AR15-10]MDR8390246.1 EpsG family protein [Aliifodinibius sp. S!AR15-10]